MILFKRKAKVLQTLMCLHLLYLEKVIVLGINLKLIILNKYLFMTLELLNKESKNLKFWVRS